MQALTIAGATERKAVYGEYVCLPSWLVASWKKIHGVSKSVGQEELFPALTADECDAFLLLLQEIQKQLVLGEDNPTLSKNTFLRNYSASRESQRRHGIRLFDFLSSFGLREGSRLQKIFSGQLRFEGDDDCRLDLELEDSAKDALMGCRDALVQMTDRVFHRTRYMTMPDTSTGKNWYLSRILWGDLSSRERILYCLFADYLQRDDFYAQWDGTQVVPINLIFEQSGMTSRDFLKSTRLISRKMEDHGHLESHVDLQFPFYPQIDGDVGSFLKLQAEHSRSFVESRYKENLSGYISSRRVRWCQHEDAPVEKVWGFVSHAYGCSDFSSVYKASFDRFAGTDQKGLLELPRYNDTHKKQKNQTCEHERMLLCHPVDIAVELLARKNRYQDFHLAEEFDLKSAESVCRFAEALTVLYQKDSKRWEESLPENIWLADSWNPEMIKHVREWGRPKPLQESKSREENPLLVEEPVVSKNAPEVDIDKPSSPVISQSSMITTARRELGGLRRNDYRHYERVRQAYMESLDPSTLQIVKEMQKRLPRDLFDDQLGDRISHFMVDNPHLWKTRLKPAAFN